MMMAILFIIGTNHGSIRWRLYDLMSKAEDMRSCKTYNMRDTDGDIQLKHETTNLLIRHVYICLCSLALVCTHLDFTNWRNSKEVFHRREDCLLIKLGRLCCRKMQTFLKMVVRGRRKQKKRAVVLVFARNALCQWTNKRSSWWCLVFCSSVLEK